MQLQNREKRQEWVQQERRQRATDLDLREAYAAYLALLREQMRREHPKQFTEFEAHLARLPEYQRCFANLKRYDDQAGPLSKAARQLADKACRDLFDRHFAGRFQDQGVIDFEAWKARHGRPALEANRTKS